MGNPILTGAILEHLKSPVSIGKHGASFSIYYVLWQQTWFKPKYALLIITKEYFSLIFKLIGI